MSHYKYKNPKLFSVLQPRMYIVLRASEMSRARVKHGDE